MFAKTSLTALVALAATAASAATWTPHGDVLAQANGGYTLTNASATFDDDYPLAAGALNLSGQEALLGGSDLEWALGLTAGAFDLSDVQQAMEGSAISALFTVKAGDTLRFDWQLSTRDVGEGFGLDYAFVAIGGQLINLGSASQATQPGSGDFLAQSGWQQFSYTFAQGGTYQVALGVVDVRDFVGSTALSVSAVTAVPEPETIAMLLAGLGVIGLRRRG